MRREINGTAASVASSLDSLLLLARNMPIELMDLLKNQQTALSVLVNAFIAGEETDENKLTDIFYQALQSNGVAVGSRGYLTKKALKQYIVQPFLRTPSVSVYPYLKSGTDTCAPLVDRFDPHRKIRKKKKNGSEYDLVGKKNRDPNKIIAAVLHQTAYAVGNKIDQHAYLDIGANYVILPNGSIVRLYPYEHMVWASNELSPLSVAIEFAGNYPDEKYHWWQNQKCQNIRFHNHPSPAQINAGRCLLRKLQQDLPNLKAVYAHRQSSNQRTNDPGPDIWFNVGEWAQQTLGLQGRDVKVDSGKPIPASWRMARITSVDTKALKKEPYHLNTKCKKDTTNEITSEEEFGWLSSLFNLPPVQQPQQVTPPSIPHSSGITITGEQLQQLGSGDLTKLRGIAAAINQYAPLFGITTPLRMAHFLAQTSHETGNYRLLTENLNYSSERMMTVWPQRFPTLTDTLPYVKNPMALANKVYAGRLGNTQPNDGYAYRGRGVLQVTGKANYAALTHWYRTNFPNNPKNFVQNPDLLAQLPFAVLSAFWFFQKGNLNQIADRDDIVTMTKRINGGFTGLDHRRTLLAKAKRILGI